MKRLGQLQGSLGVSLKDMASLVTEILHKEPYSKQEICDKLAVTSEELAETSLSPNTLQGSIPICDNGLSHTYHLDASTFILGASGVNF